MEFILKKKLEMCHLLYSCEKKVDRALHSLISYNDRPVCNLDKRVVQRSFRD